MMKKILLFILFISIFLGAKAQLILHSGAQLGTYGDPIDSAKIVVDGFVFYNGGIGYSTDDGGSGGEGDSATYTYRIIPQSSPPSPSEGLIYYDIDDHILRVWDGTQWDTCNVVGEGGGTTYTFTNGVSESGGTVILNINGIINSGTSIAANDLLGYYDATADLRTEKITYSNFLTKVESDIVVGDANVADNITLTNITQVTSRSHTSLSDIGSNTHSQIDTHIGSTSNPHSVDETDVLPSQTGQSGKFLSTNGTSTLWDSPGGGGTVLSVAAGNGMNFTTITSSGSVTLGTPSTLTPSTTNALTSTSHTHALDLSTWTGNTSILSLGTITTGTWTGSSIADAYIDNNITLTNITQITNRSHTSLSDIGTNTHSQIDTHLGSTSNPHSVDKTDVGLSNVENTALSTWVGSTYITTLGTIGTGTWQGNNIGETYTLPSQTGNSGKFLTTNGTATSWGTPPAGTVTSVASGNGMNFTTITGSGTVTMGTPTTLTLSTTNATTTTSHTHALSIANFTSSTAGLAPLSGGGTTNFLRADGTWAEPPGSGVVPDSSFLAVDYTPTSSVTPVKGRLFWDSDDDYFKVYDGSNWYILNPPILGLDSVASMLEDTIGFVFGFGLGNVNDTASCQTGAILGRKYLEQDSALMAKLITQATGTSASFGAAIYADKVYLDATPEFTIWSGTVTTSQASITTFTKNKLPPDYFLWAEITSSSKTTRANHAILELEWTRRRHYTP